MPKFQVIMEDDSDYEVEAEDGDLAAWKGCNLWIANAIGNDNRLERYYRLWQEGLDFGAAVDLAMYHDMSCPVNSVHWLFVDPSIG